MKLSNKLSWILLLALGCSSMDDGIIDDGSADAEGDEIELGTTHQAVGVKFSPSFGYGVSPVISHISCTPNNATQSCQVPIKKFNISWCFMAEGTQLDAQQKTIVQSGFTAVQQGGAAFTFVHQADGAACSTAVNNGTVNIGINAAGSGLCSGGSTSTSIDSYVCINLPQGNQLTESLGNVPGNFFSGVGDGAGVSFLHIDLTDITNQCASNPANCAPLLKHGVAHSAMAAIGMGFRTDRTDLWTSRSILPFSSSRVVSAGEACRGQAFNPSQPTDLAKTQGAQCASD